MATISVRVEDKVKKQLLEYSDEIGISVSSLFTIWIKSFLRKKKVILSLDSEDDEMYLNKEVLQKQFEQSVQSGRGTLIL